FSTGVLLALVGGELAADAVEIALQQNNFRASQFSEYSDVVRYNLEAMRKLVYAFYNDAFNFRSFFEKYPQLRSDVTDILIGKTDRSYDELFNAMREFAELPADLPHGKPLIAETV
ncbi:MAG: alkylhalidase, partial [Calditrichaeota bacterium]|nr:alkylhalidase [Calditrichota bacterium]